MISRDLSDLLDPGAEPQRIRPSSRPSTRNTQRISNRQKNFVFLNNRRKLTQTKKIQKMEKKGRQTKATGNGLQFTTIPHELLVHHSPT
jgi:hypothetical protein